MSRFSDRLLLAGLLAAPLLLLLFSVLINRLNLVPEPGVVLQAPVEPLPSSTAVPSSEVDRGLPLMSLWLEARDLYDLITGILANTEGRGREWARPGFMSYFDDGTATERAMSRTANVTAVMCTTSLA